MSSQCFMRLYTFILVLSSYWLWVWKQLNEGCLWLCWYECSCSLLLNAVYKLCVNAMIGFNLCLHVIMICLWYTRTNSLEMPQGQGSANKSNRRFFPITRWRTFKVNTEYVSIITSWQWKVCSFLIHSSWSHLESQHLKFDSKSPQTHFKEILLQNPLLGCKKAKIYHILIVLKFTFEVACLALWMLVKEK